MTTKAMTLQKREREAAKVVRRLRKAEQREARRLALRVTTVTQEERQEHDQDITPEP
jgi:hypothetical protein